MSADPYESRYNDAVRGVRRMLGDTRPDSAVEAQRQAMWRKINRDMPSAKLKHSRGVRLRGTFHPGRKSGQYRRALAAYNKSIGQ